MHELVDWGLGDACMHVPRASVDAHGLNPPRPQCMAPPRSQGVILGLWLLAAAAAHAVLAG